MSATETFRFGPYTLRPAAPADDDLARRWTAADPWHSKSVDSRFWLEQGQNSDAYLLCDHTGPLYFARLILTAPHPSWRAVEMHIQFPPAPPGDENGRKMLQLRVSRGLIKGMDWLERILRQIRVREIYFDSYSESLIRFCVHRLGFEETGTSGTNGTNRRLLKKL